MVAVIVAVPWGKGADRGGHDVDLVLGDERLGIVAAVSSRERDRWNCPGAVLPTMSWPRPQKIPERIGDTLAET
jgi:hypothetical protein